MIKEITTYDGNVVRSRNPYESRPYTEVKIGKLYECTDCGSILKRPDGHDCVVKKDTTEINNPPKQGD
jgi:hypothetical protein